MKIGIDIMGGDYAPEATVTGAILALDHLQKGNELTLIGPEVKIREILASKNVDASNFTIVNAEEVIEMGEHPAKAFAKKTNSSIAVGFKLLCSGEIEGFSSAGNTGAMLVGSMFTVKSTPGVIRPALAGIVPKPGGGSAILLDVGLNPDCKPDVLYQYGILGSVYAERVYKIPNPKVAILNIGEEEEKGSLLAKATYEAMKGTTDFNFVGNIEGSDIFSDDKADVIVCDGYVGNIVLKEAEAVYTLLKKRNIKDDFFERFNFENYGGSPILGINSNIIIGHGVSNAKAVKNMILLTKNLVDAGLPQKFKEVFK